VNVQAARQIPLSRPDVGPQEEEYVLAALRSGVLGLGPYARNFEKEFAAFCGSEHAVSVSSGTAGLHLCVHAAGIGAGDEVVTAPISFVASANVMLFEGAVPVFADVDPETFVLDPAAVEAAITPRTRAVMPVHLFGHPAAMGPLRVICKKHGLALLEDAAQAYGASLDGVRCGALGDAATFSYFPTKTLPSFGDGGLITTPSAEVDRMCRVLRFHGSEDTRTFTHVGYNSRLDEIQAAILLELRPLVDGWNDGRIAVAARYEELGLG
jgi:dTDP-4-amino-4,6-dideoxygalactose transaminase